MDPGSGTAEHEASSRPRDCPVFLPTNYQRAHPRTGQGNLPVSRARAILCLVQLNAKKSQPGAARTADFRRVLADTGGKDQCIKAAQRTRHGGNTGLETVNKNIKSQLGALIPLVNCLKDVTHVTGDTRDP